MRVTQSLNQAQFLAALTQLESNLSQTQNQISTNLAFTAPSQNPVAAGNVNNYDQALAQSQQYDANAGSAQTRLSTEDTALAQAQTELQSSRCRPTMLPFPAPAARRSRRRLRKYKTVCHPWPIPRTATASTFSAAFPRITNRSR
jgi:hypothetical protein